MTGRPTATAAATAAAGTTTPDAPCTDASRAPAPVPAARPAAEPASPTIAASARTAAASCRRPAPITRSSASSRVRWATRIENVLRIRNAPTNRATQAKPSSRVLVSRSDFDPASAAPSRALSCRAVLTA
ncbi:hypothetical protein OHA72_32530 [Dactylosporangium sp. NBC_01737]|nr:hypothetical protein OHA72_32530 [Dactylosporangium sp. NBC_01737]